MKLVTHVDPAEAARIIDQSHEMRSKGDRARKPEMTQSYYTAAAALRARYEAMPKKLSDDGYEQVLEAIDGDIHEMQRRLNEYKKKADYDLLYFIEQYAEEFIVLQTEVNFYTRLRATIVETRKSETHHWVVWLNDIFKVFSDDVKKQISSNARGLYNCTSPAYNLVKMEQLKAYVGIYEDRDFHYTYGQLQCALEWAKKNDPAILTAVIPVVQEKSNTECAPAQAQAVAQS